MAKKYLRKIVSVIVVDSPNVMTRVASVLGRRGFNIETITVSSTGIPGHSRITIVFDVEEVFLNQIITQIERMEVVKQVNVLNRGENLYREMMLVKLDATPGERDSIIELAKVYEGKVVDLTTSSMIVEITGFPEKIDSFLELMQEFSVADYCRSGVLAVESNHKNLKLLE